MSAPTDDDLRDWYGQLRYHLNRFTAHDVARLVRGAAERWRIRHQSARLGGHTDPTSGPIMSMAIELESTAQARHRRELCEAYLRGAIDQSAYFHSVVSVDEMRQLRRNFDAWYEHRGWSFANTRGDVGTTRAPGVNPYESITHVIVDDEHPGILYWRDGDDYVTTRRGGAALTTRPHALAPHVMRPMTPAESAHNAETIARLIEVFVRAPLATVRSEPCAAPDGGTCTCERNEDGQVTSHSLGACPVHAYGAATRAHNARTQHDACTCRRTDDGRGIYPSGACPVHARTHGGGMAGHD